MKKVKKRKRIAGFDGNWYLHRAYQTLHTNRPIEDALPFHLMSMMMKDALAVRAEYVLVAFDGPKVFRYDIFPGYKAARKAKKGIALSDEPELHKDDIYSYLPAIYDRFGSAGIQIYQPRKHEADDVLNSIAYEYAGLEYSFVACAQDKDGYQGLKQGIASMYDASHKNKLGESAPRYIDAAFAEKQKGVTVKQMIDYQTLLGDSGDSIPKIAGMTPEKVVKLLTEYGSIRNWYKEDPDARVFLTEQQANLTRNRKLVTLATNITPNSHIDSWKLPKVKPSGDFPKSYHEYHRFLYPKHIGLFD